MARDRFHDNGQLVRRHDERGIDRIQIGERWNVRKLLQTQFELLKAAEIDRAKRQIAGIGDMLADRLIGVSGKSTIGRVADLRAQGEGGARENRFRIKGSAFPSPSQ